MEKGEESKSRPSWQELPAEQAAKAVFGGYCHVVNNALAPLRLIELYSLDKETLKKHNLLLESFAARGLSFPQPDAQEKSENVIRKTASGFKREIEKRTRKNLQLGKEKDPGQEWFGQAQSLYFFEGLSDRDRQIFERSLATVRLAWENLKALADPKKEIKPDAKFDEGVGKPIFDFTHKLTL